MVLPSWAAGQLEANVPPLGCNARLQVVRPGGLKGVESTPQLPLTVRRFEIKKSPTADKLSSVLEQSDLPLMEDVEESDLPPLHEGERAPLGPIYSKSYEALSATNLKDDETDST